MPNKLEIVLKQILEKKFNKRIHSGYDPEDVDRFFDEVMSFLKETNSGLESQAEEIKNLKHEINSLKKQAEEKNNTINTLQQDIERYKSEGYHNIRMANQMNKLQEEVSKIKQEKK